MINVRSFIFIVILSLFLESVLGTEDAAVKKRTDQVLAPVQLTFFMGETDTKIKINKLPKSTIFSMEKKQSSKRTRNYAILGTMIRQI